MRRAPAGFWLTDRLPEMRTRMDPFPGSRLGIRQGPREQPEGANWTKWPAIQVWLDAPRTVTTSAVLTSERIARSVGLNVMDFQTCGVLLRHVPR